MLLADGTIAVIRSLRADDRDAVLELHESVSVDTLRLRFFSPSREAGRHYVAHLFAPDNTSSAALVAVAARVLFRDPLTWRMIAGIALIIAGVLTIEMAGVAH